MTRVINIFLTLKYGHCMDRLNRFGTFENDEMVPLFLKDSGIPLSPLEQKSRSYKIL